MLKTMFSRFLCALFLYAFTSAGIAAYFPSVSVAPPNPEVSDTVVVRIVGFGPDLCWRLDSVQQSVSNDTFFYAVAHSNGDCPFGCFQMPTQYTYFDTLGALSQGTYTISVLENNDPTCSGTTEGFLVETSFMVSDSVCVLCVAGDANGDGSVNIADVTFLIARIFAAGAAASCCREADADGSGSVNIADITYLIARIFAGGAAPVCGPIGMGC